MPSPGPRVVLSPCPPIFLPCSRRRWSGGSASCLDSHAAPGRRSPGSTRRASGCGRGRGRLIVQASDGSAAERARFLVPVRRRSVVVVDPLPAAALGRVFGRDHVVHVAIAPGRLGERLAVEAARLRGLRRDGGGGKTGREYDQAQADGANG